MEGEKSLAVQQINKRMKKLKDKHFKVKTANMSIDQVVEQIYCTRFYYITSQASGRKSASRWIHTNHLERNAII